MRLFRVVGDCASVIALTDSVAVWQQQPVIVSRRQMLGALVGVAGIVATSSALAEALGEMCLVTPEQTEGPYYPINDQLDKDNDLTLVNGQTGRAEGQLLYVTGQVRDRKCRPIPGALVEIWQASARGRYHHPRDRSNSAPLDPFFQSWGQTRTDGDGRYLFKTIKPASYAAGRNWIRPSHIHFKVRQPNSQEWTTQMYFAGDPHQDRDYILNEVPAVERKRVIVEMQEPPRQYEPTSRLCRFDLIL